ncbi:MAG: hypothetical protein FIB07_15420 [Candidatus Methanoperedens sp.]|nr:hypothetical protein [Candidatus Methanoperedens sp.]
MIQKSGFIRACYYFGAAADLIASLPLIFPEIAKFMFGLASLNADNGYLYVSRIGASLMLGWTLLLVWGSFKPIERKGILLLTVFPVLTGLLVSSILVLNSGFIETEFMLPLWIFYAIIIPLYIYAYILAGKIETWNFIQKSK